MNPLLANFEGVPCLIGQGMENRLEASLAAIASHPKFGELMSSSLAADDGFWFAADDWRSTYRPYIVHNGILQVPVKGVLLHDFPWAFGSFATGYLYIARAVERGLSDPNVKGIALMVNSYGGQAAGCFEACDRIFAGRQTKPIRGFANEHAYSAGYAVISSAEQSVIARTGGAGSIGVVMTHIDISKLLDQAGYKITFIHAGKHKVDGNYAEKLPEAVRKRWQQICEDHRDVFCETVARNRSMDVAAVRGTEAECFTAGEAVEKGLIDSVGSIEDAVAAFASDVSLADEQREEDDMTDKTSASAPGAVNDQALAAARSEGHAAGKVEGEKTGATAERGRISAILGCDEAKGRQSLANHIAFNTDMNVDGAKGMLGAAPQEISAAAPVDPLAAAMASVKNPQVGADKEKAEGDDLNAVSSVVKGFLGKTAA